LGREVSEGTGKKCVRQVWGRKLVIISLPEKKEKGSFSRRPETDDRSTQGRRDESRPVHAEVKRGNAYAEKTKFRRGQIIYCPGGY